MYAFIAASGNFLLPTSCLFSMYFLFPGFYKIFSSSQFDLLAITLSRACCEWTAVIILCVLIYVIVRKLINSKKK